MYKNKSSLTRHLTLECGIDGTYQCIICRHYFKRKYQLEKHLKIHKLCRM